MMLSFHVFFMSEHNIGSVSNKQTNKQTWIQNLRGNNKVQVKCLRSGNKNGNNIFTYNVKWKKYLALPVTLSKLSIG